MRSFRFIVGTGIIPIIILLSIQLSIGDKSADSESSLAVLKAPSYFDFKQPSSLLKTSRLTDLILAITGFEIDQVNINLRKMMKT